MPPCQTSLPEWLRALCPAAGAGPLVHDLREVPAGVGVQAAERLADALPDGRRAIVQGAGHVADPLALAPPLERFVGATPASGAAAPA